MILKSEGKSIKYVTEPPRDRKYTIMAYSRLLAEGSLNMPPDALQ